MNPTETARNLAFLLKQSLNRGEKTLSLDEKKYVCSPGLLGESFRYISNNDSGHKRILFDFDGVKSGFTLDGNGANLQIIGEVIPCYIKDSSHIIIKNLAIDWIRPSISEAIVTCSNKDYIEFTFDPRCYPLRVDNGRLVAYHDNYWSTDVLWNMLCFDINRKELLPEQDENWHLKDYHFAEQLNSTTIRLFAHYTTVPCKGTLIAFMHGNRVCPGIVIDNSEFVTVQGVTVHHAMGMALIAQVSNNITLDRFNVVPSQGRVFSSWVDATHFADCDGTIELKDCCFKGQFDDASNIHGAFWNVDKIHSSKKIAVKIMHPQQAGVVVFRKGDVVKFYHRKSLGYLSENTIANVKIHSNSEYELDLTRDLQLNSGQLVVSRYTEHCFVHIHNCEFGANRGRGLLLSQSGTIHVEENIFHVSGSAIVMAGDTTYWWESSAVNNVLIKNNRFIDCNFGVCGKYLFAVCPDIEKENRSDFFHKNISIVDNDIICHHSSILSARCISGLIYKNNRCVRSASYAFNSSLKPLDLQEMVESVEIEVS